MPEQYVSLDQHAVSGAGFQSTTISVADYPVNATDPATLRFEFRVATPEGVGSETVQGQNPAFDGDVPELAAIDLSTLRPGPSETVTVDVNPAEDSSFRRVSSATVYGPSGAQLDASNVTGGDTVSFQTSGAGRYTVRLHVAATDGTTVAETVHLSAGATSRERPASLRAATGPTGTYVLAGEGFAGGMAEVSGAGDSLELVGELLSSAKRPSQVHVHTASVQPGRTRSKTPVSTPRRWGRNRFPTANCSRNCNDSLATSAAHRRATT